MASGFSDALVPQVVKKSLSASVATAIYSTTQLVFAFTVSAPSSNTKVVSLGASNVASAAIHLGPGDTFSSPVITAGGSNPRQYDLGEWYVRATAASQVVHILKIRKAQELV